MNTLWTIAVKDLRLLLRDRMNAFFTFVFPLLIAVFFATVFGGGASRSKLPVVIVNEDGGPASVAFVKDLEDSGGLDISSAANRAEGESIVRRDKAIASIVIPAGFEKASEGVFAGASMRIEGVTDPTHQAESGLLIGKLNEIGYRQMMRAFSEPARMDKMIGEAKKAIDGAKGISPGRKLLLDALFGSLGTLNKSGGGIAGGDATAANASKGDAAPGFSFQPVQVELTELKSTDTGPNPAEVAFPQGIIWGLMGCVTAFASSLAGERARGTLMRLTCAPIFPWQILVGKALACFVACMAVQVMLILVGVVFFKINVRAPVLLGLAMVVSSVGFVGVMMFMAGMSSTEGGSGGLSRAVILMLAMIGGGTIPIMFMPPWMQTMTGISPFKWAGQAIQGALWRGLGFGDLWVPSLVLLGMGVVGFAHGLVAFKRSAAV